MPNTKSTNVEWAERFKVNMDAVNVFSFGIPVGSIPTLPNWVLSFDGEAPGSYPEELISSIREPTARVARLVTRPSAFNRSIGV